MGFTLKTFRDPYDMGFSTTRLKYVTIEEGVTILIGCNGIGKTTMLMNIDNELSNNNKKCIKFDGLKTTQEMR